MEGTGTGTTAMLVGTPGDAGERPDAATVTLTREEIQEALASDAPLDLILSVQPAGGEPRDVSVGWQRADLETVLAGVDAGPITFSFDRAELYRALEHPDFEGHGIRELVLLVAAASSSAALAASTASGQLLDSGGGGGASAAAVVPGHGEASTARDLAAGVAAPASDEAGAAARGIGVGVPGADEAGATARGLDPAIATAMEATTARDLAEAAGPAVDEAGAAARGIGVSVPGADEAGLDARGVHVAAVHDEGTLVTRGIEAPAAPVDSGSGIELPSVDSGAAAAIGAAAGAGLLILGAAFAARRRTTPA